MARRKTARRLHRLDVEILAWHPYLDVDAFRAEGVTKAAELSELAARFRVLSTHPPLIEGRTEKVVGADLLRLPPR